MFVRQPQFRNSNADVQIFYGNATNQSATDALGTNAQQTWNKPPGVSHVYMMLIGCGGNGDATSGGGSGAVTVWYGAAQNVPDSLIVHLGSVSAGINTFIEYRNGTATYILLQANSANGPSGGSTVASNAFAASGFFRSVQGQNGGTGNQPASAETFLSGGTDVNATTITANYGYGLLTGGLNTQGQFYIQPIIVGVGAKGAGRGGVGCGGGYVGTGGQGMVLIASW